MKVKNKTGENIIDKFLGVLLSYPLAIACILVFALFCSGRVGWFLLLAAIGAPLISLVWTLIARRFVSVKIVSGSRLLEKGQVGSFDIVIENRCLLAVPEITVQIGTDEHINIKQKNFTVYSRGIGETVLSAEIFSVFAGPADIKIEKAVVRDFFGLFRFNLAAADSKKISKTDSKTDSKSDSKENSKINSKINSYNSDSVITIGILPENKTLLQEDDWLASARSAAFDGEEPENSTDDASVTFSGFPGYEHREYVPGDPIKRINYKLSARMGRLQVRLDEQQAVAGISLMLAPRLPDDLGEQRGGALVRASSMCLDEMMGVAAHLYMLDFAVTVYLPNHEGFELKEGRDIEVLREMLAIVRFSSDAADCTPGIREASGTIIAFMPYQEDKTIEELKKYTGVEGNNVTVYISSIEKGRRL